VVWLAVSLLDTFTSSYWYLILVQPIYVPFFVAGVVCYLMHRFRPSRTLWTLLGCCWAIAMYRLVSRTAGQHPSGVTLNYWVSVTIVTAFFVLLTLIALGKLDAIRGQWLITAGALTYPLYLLHQQVGETLIRVLDGRIPAWFVLVIALATMLALAWLVQRFAERPMANRIRTVLLAGLAKVRSRRHTVTSGGAQPHDDVATDGKHRHHAATGNAATSDAGNPATVAVDCGAGFRSRGHGPVIDLNRCATGPVSAAQRGHGVASPTEFAGEGRS
jgi:peptidoglycan/LPS O-acetylase OafA/YrhL